ncbi:type I-E CRISPR-associated protein Cse2/CasB [Nocardiopsis rhodophaea]|uniref:Type I-E CRISPR-associated protein Cse2/CasB n=1 Tax=Nocardiopsis rhodophaea TaxID=280238 RepID=A0ABP5ET48_9ACTN
MTQTARDTQPRTYKERRSGYVNRLYELGREVELQTPYRVAAARRTLARLRRSLVDDRFLPDAMAIAVEFDPPQGGRRDETEPWLLVAGLYALHPRQPLRGEQRLGLGGALSTYSTRDSVEARMRQLLSADWPTLRYRLRQAVQMLSGSDIALDYHALLADLVELHHAPAGGAKAHGVHLRWASDFQRAAHANRSNDDGDDRSDDTNDEAGASS